MDKKICLKLLFIIIKRGKGDEVVGFLRRLGVPFPSVIMGKGTAPNKWMSLMGIGDVEKDVVLSVVNGEDIEKIMAGLEQDFVSGKAGEGIAFTVRLSSIAGGKMLKVFCKGDKEENNG